MEAEAVAARKELEDRREHGTEDEIRAEPQKPLRRDGEPTMRGCTMARATLIGPYRVFASARLPCWRLPASRLLSLIDKLSPSRLFHIPYSQDIPTVALATSLRKVRTPKGATRWKRHHSLRRARDHCSGGPLDPGRTGPAFVAPLSARRSMSNHQSRRRVTRWHGPEPAA